MRIKGTLLCLSAFAAVFATVASGSVERTSAPVTLRGDGMQNVRPFTLTADSNVSWRCAGCAGSNFVFSTRQNIPVNALGQLAAKASFRRAVTRESV